MSVHKGTLPTLTFFGSLSTLLCCALPALFVALGAGASLIGLVSAFPQLVWLSEHKVPLFVFAGLMLALSGISRFLTRHAPCPADAAQAKTCLRLRRIGLYVFCLSLTFYVTGFYFAFIASRI